MEDYPHTHPIPIPMGIPMGISIPTAALEFGYGSGPQFWRFWDYNRAIRAIFLRDFVDFFCFTLVRSLISVQFVGIWSCWILDSRMLHDWWDSCEFVNQFRSCSLHYANKWLAIAKARRCRWSSNMSRPSDLAPAYAAIITRSRLRPRCDTVSDKKACTHSHQKVGTTATAARRVECRGVGRRLPSTVLSSRLELVGRAGDVVMSSDCDHTRQVSRRALCDKCFARCDTGAEPAGQAGVSCAAASPVGIYPFKRKRWFTRFVRNFSFKE